MKVIFAGPSLPDAADFAAADIRILPKNDLTDKAGAEHDRLRFAKDNDWTLPVSQPVADWLVANDAFELV